MKNALATDHEEELIDGKYRLGRLLGEGGMGSVYAGENVRIGRRVAIKILRSSFAHHDEFVLRFEREAFAASRIDSTHVADVLDLGELPTGQRYIVMELLEGESLADRFDDRGRLTPQELLPIATQLLEGLGAIHAAGILHRDLKPANIFLVPTSDGDFVKILDLGVCRFLNPEREAEVPKSRRVSRAVAADLTMSGMILGTPAYMSPELILGAGVDTRADIYAVGVLLFRAVTGRPPFDADSISGVVRLIALAEGAPEVDAAVDPDFAAIIRKAMAPDPDERYRSCAEFLQAIQTWQKQVRSVDQLLAAFLSRPPPAPEPSGHAVRIPRPASVPRISEVIPKADRRADDAELLDAETIPRAPRTNDLTLVSEGAPPPQRARLSAVLVACVILAAGLFALVAGASILSAPH